VRWAVCAVMMAVALGQGGAQFDVGRVRGGSIYKVAVSRTPEQLAFGATRVGDIIAFAYGLPADRVDRQPQWMYNTFFDVAVTTPGPVSLPEQKVLLQKLLEERFGLVAHKLTQNGWVYAMTAGPNVTLAPTKELDTTDGVAEFLPQRPVQNLVGASNTLSGFVGAKHASMGDLAAWMYTQVKRPVIDKTGITGLFDIEISGGPSWGGAEQTISAVRKSTGLEFKVELGPVETLIIDRAEPPNAE